MVTMATVKEVGERKLVDNIRSIIRPRSENTVIGPGDDAAVIVVAVIAADFRAAGGNEGAGRIRGFSRKLRGRHPESGCGRVFRRFGAITEFQDCRRFGEPDRRGESGRASDPGHGA